MIVRSFECSDIQTPIVSAAGAREKRGEVSVHEVPESDMVIRRQAASCMRAAARHNTTSEKALEFYLLSSSHLHRLHISI